MLESATFDTGKDKQRGWRCAGVDMVSSHSALDGFRLVARRNDSLGVRGRRRFFASMAVVSFGIALAWSARGAWMVLPFALVEMMVLYAALLLLERHADDFESITIEGDRLLVERRDRGAVSRHEFNTYWARLVVTRGPAAGQTGLALRSHGKEVSVGSFLTDDQRASLAGELQKRLNKP
jgi:uncharacterized membrane protein